jgi:hypothetical protein
MKRKPYDPGTLVKINTLTTATSDGFSTARAALQNTILVTEFIDLESFPSCKDYHGKEVQCRHGEPATILAFLGRPYRITSPVGWEYDVYEILVNENVCQIFSVNLNPLM